MESSLAVENTLFFNSKKLFAEGGLLVFGIFIVNTLATIFYWYSSIWWFDMPMHFFGGAWLGLMGLSLCGMPWIQRRKQCKSFLEALIFVFFFVFIIAVSWEIFEFVLQKLTGALLANPLDSLSDIMFDLAGGFSAILYAIITGFFVYQKETK